MRTFFIAFALWAGINLIAGDVESLAFYYEGFIWPILMFDGSHSMISNIFWIITYFCLAILVLSQNKNATIIALIMLICEATVNFRELRLMYPDQHWVYYPLISLSVCALLSYRHWFFVNKAFGNFMMYKRMQLLINSIVKGRLREWFMCLCIAASAFTILGQLDLYLIINSEYFKDYSNIIMDNMSVLFAILCMIMGVVFGKICLHLKYSYSLKKFIWIALVYNFFFILLYWIPLPIHGTELPWFKLYELSPWIGLMLGMWIERKLVTSIPDKAVPVI